MLEPKFALEQSLGPVSNRSRPKICEVENFRAHSSATRQRPDGYCGHGLQAQEMEPRSYSAVPIDTNFLIASYQRTTGDVGLDPSLPIANVKAAIDSGILAYNRTFDLFGQTGSAAIVMPYFQANLSGDVGAEGRQISREGWGDFAFRFTENLIGSPALTPAEFARRRAWLSA